MVFAILLFILLFFNQSLSLPDYEALLNFKKSLSQPQILDDWVATRSPCNSKNPWVGVICDDSVVVGLHLSQLSLSGKIHVGPLLELPRIRTLSFVNNSFSGQIPDFNRLGALKSLLLSRNNFSGEIRDDYFGKMASLKKLWLNSNAFSGPIPNSLGQLPHLIELHLENNQFSGRIPTIFENNQFSGRISSLDFSNNRLEGEIPASLGRFTAKSFHSNPGLCGEQINKPCDKPLSQSNSTQTTSNNGGSKSKLSMILIGSLVLIILVFGFSTATSGRNRGDHFKILYSDARQDEPIPVRVAAAPNRCVPDSSRKISQNPNNNNKGSTDLVMLNEDKGSFGMSDLMKAAAEVLGNGGLGSAYKAVMESGLGVVVKRLRGMNNLGREDFDMEMKRIGILRHRNILTPLAYHFRKDEKLLVSEYIPKGSLLYVLHGDHGISHAELNWATRLKIIQGLAKGLGFLHSEFPSHDVPHGNLKSCNVLLDSDYEPLLTDYAFHPLIVPESAPHSLSVYKTPEAIQGDSVSPKSDVYCLGLVVLEILTGKFPSQYLANGKGGTDVVELVDSAVSEGHEEETFDMNMVNSAPNCVEKMEAMLHVGHACVESNPEKRIDVREAIRRIEVIQK